jgi:hypothetical protein
VPSTAWRNRHQRYDQTESSDLPSLSSENGLLRLTCLVGHPFKGALPQRELHRHRRDDGHRRAVEQGRCESPAAPRRAPDPATDRCNTFASFTAPSGPMVASITMPCTRADCAIGGYTDARRGSSAARCCRQLAPAARGRQGAVRNAPVVPPAMPPIMPSTRTRSKRLRGRSRP